jgi:hypothetical protein
MKCRCPVKTNKHRKHGQYTIKSTIATRTRSVWSAHLFLFSLSLGSMIPLQLDRVRDKRLSTKIFTRNSELMKKKEQKGGFATFKISSSLSRVDKKSIYRTKD